MDKDLELLHQKIDFLTEQVMVTQRRQKEMEYLRRDLTPIASDLFKTVVEELDEVAPYFSYEDLIFLVKKLLRNTRTLIVLFENMESATDFFNDAAPLSKAVFQSALEGFDTMERKGYFTFVKGAGDVIDEIVTSFSEQDVKQFGENVVSILNTVKQLTQPEMLNAIQNALTIYKNIEVKPPEKISVFGLVKELNSPEVRKGIATGLAILKNISINMEAQSLLKEENEGAAS
ncbi:MAG: DUF1641 domain-containing protein [Actinobacteria bacterium]|nr:DUF1641 domain-containing protein [Actinomycetota bacterium]